MTLLVGTLDGVHRASLDDAEVARPVLDCGDAVAVGTLPGLEGIFAATRTGLYRTTDEGDTWENLGVPRSEVFSVAASPDGRRLYAGTHPAHLYASDDEGDTWTDLEGLQELASRDTWHTPRHRDAAHVRTLATHTQAPDRVVAGIEVGGVHVSDDGGRSWHQRREGLGHERDDDLQYDVHHVLMTDADTLYVSCGYGFYRSRDAGASWTRLDPPTEHRYFHASHEHDGRLFVAAETFPPGPYGGEQVAGGMLFASSDAGDTLDPVAYPGSPEEVATALASAGDRLIVGTSEGRVLALEGNTWEQVSQTPNWVRSLAAT